MFCKCEKMYTVYPGESQIIVNNSEMQLNVDDWQTFSSDTYMINNAARLQAKIGYFMSDGPNNTMIYTTGFLLNITAGVIRMNGNNNVGLTVLGKIFMNIDQIFGNNTGDMGIRVQDAGQLYGHVSQITTIDQTCIEFTGNQESNFTFDSLNCQSGFYVVYVSGGVINMSGKSITSDTVNNPIYIVSQDSKFNLQLDNMDINYCITGIYSETINGDTRINIQNFNIKSNSTATGIYANKGTLYLEGNYYMESADNIPLIILEGEVNLKANLGYVNTSHMVMNTKTSGDIWYESYETITRGLENNVSAEFPNPSQKVTFKGMFNTSGDCNLYIITSAQSFIRVIDCVMISSFRNILSPVINIISNYSIGNTGISGGVMLPPGSFITDGGVQ